MRQKRQLLTAGLLCLSMAGVFLSQAQGRSRRVMGPAAEATGKPSAWIDNKVQQLSHSPFEARLRYWILSRIGTPYVLGHLGEAKYPDQDPVFELGKADCTTFVLTSTALAQSTSLAQARDRMESLNYRCKAGWCPITYENRLHFTEDRINGGSMSYQDITKQIKAPQEAFETVKMVLNRKADGNPLLDLHWERAMTLTYIRTPYLDENILKQLPPLVGVAFIRKSYFTNGLAASHEGFVLDRANLVHASSLRGKVAEENLLTYLRPKGQEARHDGVMFYRIYPGSNPHQDRLLQAGH